VDQFKEIPLLESLLNFQKEACNICHIPSKCYYFTLQNSKQCKGGMNRDAGCHHFMPGTIAPVFIAQIKANSTVTGVLFQLQRRNVLQDAT